MGRALELGGSLNLLTMRCMINGRDDAKFAFDAINNDIRNEPDRQLTMAFHRTWSANITEAFQRFCAIANGGNDLARICIVKAFQLNFVRLQSV
jgi:hypothetical protein